MYLPDDMTEQELTDALTEQRGGRRTISPQEALALTHPDPMVRLNNAISLNREDRS